jgi:hypothetical protein
LYHRFDKCLFGKMLDWPRPNGLRISRRKRAAYASIKKGTISRAKRSDCMRVLDGALGLRFARR